jgi:hypothetical protein
MIDEEDYRRRLNRLRQLLQRVDTAWQVRFYRQVTVEVVGNNPYIPKFTGVIGSHMLLFSATVCSVPEERHRTHYRRCLELMNLMAQERGHGRFYLTEVGVGCRVEWVMALPEVMLDGEIEHFVTALQLGIERLAVNTSRFYRLFESTEGYVSDIYDYDDVRPHGRA